MCHGHVDHHIAMREAEDRIRAVQSVAETAELPAARPVWREVFARIARIVQRHQTAD